MPYPGGKGNAYHQIINRIPPHEIYIEAFAGGAAVALTKKPAQINFLIDRDRDAIQTLRAENRPHADWRFIWGDALQWLDAFVWQGQEFVYLDPPYLKSTRRDPNRDLYTHEMTEAQHVELLDIARRLPCCVMISGYYSVLYTNTLTDWHFHKFKTMTRGGLPATEYLWMNYPPPDRLHDYRYLGSDFRERERIKRKTKRWVANLRDMPSLERQAILSAIKEEFAEASPGMAREPGHTVRNGDTHRYASPNTARAAPIAEGGEAR